MYYINAKPNETGNYGNPMGKPFEGCLELPEDFLGDYCEARGFILPTIEDGAVVDFEPNQEALDAYLAEYPDVEPAPEPTAEDATWADMAAAIREGVNAV